MTSVTDSDGNRSIDRPRETTLVDPDASVEARSRLRPLLGVSMRRDATGPASRGRVRRAMVGTVRRVAFERGREGAGILDDARRRRAWCCISRRFVTSGRQVCPRAGIRWPFVAAGYALAEVAVLHVEFRRNAHSMSLNEIPLLIGLVFLSPSQLLLAHLVGTAIVLAVFQRQPALKLFFNLAHFALEDCLAIMVFFALVGRDPSIGPRLWMAGFGAALVASAVGVLTVSMVIWLHQSRIDVEQVRAVFGVSAAGTMFNTCVGLVAVTVLWVDVRGWVLLAPIARDPRIGVPRRMRHFANDTRVSNPCTSSPRSYAAPVTRRPSSRTCSHRPVRC